MISDRPPTVNEPVFWEALCERVRRLFTPEFTFLETYAPAESAERRAGLEWMVRARPRPAALTAGTRASSARSNSSATP